MSNVELPPFQDFIDPTFMFFADGKVHASAEIFESVANQMALTEEQRALVTPKQKLLRYVGHIRWSITYLRVAGLLENEERGKYKLSHEGTNLLKEKKEQLDINFLT